MNEYRCTSNAPYSNPKCFGYTDLAARQGYYIKAESEQEAIALMQQEFPDDTTGFTIELWVDDFSESQPDDSKRYLYRLYPQI